MRYAESAGRLLVGDVIAGKYRIESIAGEGGMGIVYEAEHVILRQRVAVKVLQPGSMSSSEAVERFSVEAAAIARIASEHVVRIMDAGSLPNGAPYLVMEFLDGCDLDELIARRGPLPVATVVDYALQALDGLAHAHAARVIHRDLKPANLFLARTPDGREIIKLVDFGIAKSFDVGTDDGRVAGSPIYMAPEQLRNEPVDARSDIWSLGVVVYELLSGAPPFHGNFTSIVEGILRQDVVPLANVVPSVAAELSQIVGRCLQRDLGSRWPTIAELARALLPHGTGAWASAIERIGRARAQSTPVRAPRRYESFENALSALESEEEAAPETLDPHEVSITSKAPSKVRSPEVFGDTIPAPPSEPSVEIQLPPELVSPPSVKRDALRLLLIDDSELVLGIHAHVLTAAGFSVRTTTTPSEFDVLLESWKPHLVIMDVEMPAVTGDELCRRVKAKFRATVPVVFLSDLARDQLEERARAGGADAFFSKTSDWDSLVVFVRNICAMTYSPDVLP